MTASATVRMALCDERATPASTTARGTALSVAIIRDVAGFLALRHDWDALFARAAQPQQVFQSHVFLRHWATHYLDAGSELSIVTARQDGRLVMVWPLLRQRRLGFVTLRFMGVPVAQFGDVLVERTGDEHILLAAGWRAVRALRADLLEISRLRADANLPGVGEHAIARERRQAPCAELALRVGPDGPGSVYPARERSNYRRRLRRLGEHGAVSFASVSPGPEATSLAVEAIAMKQAALTRHGIVAPTISDPRFAAFFRDLAGDREGGSPLRITAISCAGAAVGIDIALDCKRTSFGHVLATHPDHERGGVGGMLVHRSFAAAKARGNAHFDLLAPADSYKLEHADRLIDVVDWTVPLSFAGRLVCQIGLRPLRPALREALSRLPPSLARRIAAWSNSSRQ